MKKKSTLPRVRVDFNEMVENNLVLLCKEDIKIDCHDKPVQLSEGLKIEVFEVDSDEDGVPDFLIATGVVELNRLDDWSSHVKWCCRIDEGGINYESEIVKKHTDR